MQHLRKSVSFPLEAPTYSTGADRWEVHDQPTQLSIHLPKETAIENVTCSYWECILEKRARALQLKGKGECIAHMDLSSGDLSPPIPASAPPQKANTVF